MQRFCSRLQRLLVFALLSWPLLCGGSAHAVGAPSAAFAPVQASAAFSPSMVAARPTVRLWPSATCDANSSVQDCANAFIAPLNRPFGIAVQVIMGLIGGLCLIGGLLSLARGAGGGIFNEPRWVSRALAGIGGVILIFVFALVLVNVFGNLPGVAPASCTPKLGGGCQ